MKTVYDKYSDVRAACMRWGFGTSWFAASSLSLHSTGTAVDLTGVQTADGTGACLSQVLLGPADTDKLRTCPK